jgi:hypothetical protein
MTTLVPKYDQGGTNAVNRPFNQKLQEIVSVLDFGADNTGNSSVDSYAGIMSAINSFANNPSVYFPAGVYYVSQPINLTVLGTHLYGAGKTSTQIVFKSGFSGSAVIQVNAPRCTINDMQIRGNTASPAIDGILIGNSASNSGQLLSLVRLTLESCNNGVNYISGNLQRWDNLFAESCNYGYVVTPDSGDNTNGCIMTAIGAYGCGAGLYISQGSGAIGHSLSNWDVYVEGGNNGIHIRGGEYCRYDLYIDSLNTYSGQYFFDLTSANPHQYFIKNPINYAITGGPGGGSNTSIGVVTGGANIYNYAGTSPNNFLALTPSSSVVYANGTNVNLFTVQNTNTSSQIPLYLSFLAYTPVGATITIMKLDANPGFILTSVSGYTLLGDTGVFGNFSTKTLQVTVISSTQAFCTQY